MLCGNGEISNDMAVAFEAVNESAENVGVQLALAKDGAFGDADAGM